MSQRPMRFRIEVGIEVGMFFIQQLLRPKAVKPQQPVGLI